jgi:fatty-acyl-CoA synthase
LVDTNRSQGGRPRNYAELVRRTAERVPESEALVIGEQRLTYRELLDGGRRRAAQLAALGVGAGTRFGVLMPNDPVIAECLIAGALLGATLVPINVRFKAREVRHLISNARLTAVLVAEADDGRGALTEVLYEAFPELAAAPTAAALELAAAPELTAVARVRGAGGAGILGVTELEALAATSEPACPGAAWDDPALILYTSGTTADPKGCVLSHRAVITDVEAIVKRFEIPETDRWWNPLPLFHGAGLMLMSACFVAGATAISMGRFDAGEALDVIERERPTVLYSLFPTITLALMHHPRFSEVPLEQVRVVANLAAPDVQREVQAAFAPAVLMSAYGITELSATVVFTSLDDPEEVRLTACGTALDGFELKIVDPDTGVDLEAGQTGELVGRGPSRFDAYFEDPEATRAAVDEDGYFHTGDLCLIDEDGRVFFRGRRKEMLKVGGENVSALEVEAHLVSHPAINLAQVVGVPDPRLQEVPVAFVELVPGATLTEEEVFAHCRGEIAGFKVPRAVRIVDEWPMSATKIQKFRLQEQFLEEMKIGSTDNGGES